MTNPESVTLGAPENPALDFLERACALFGAYPARGRAGMAAVPCEEDAPMDCPHCRRPIPELWLPFVVVNELDGRPAEHISTSVYDFRSMQEAYRAEVQWMRCPAPDCLKVIIRARSYQYSPEDENRGRRPALFAPSENRGPQASTDWKDGDWWFAVPRRGAAREPHPDVPEKYAQDYREAALIMEDSPQASAALTRRVLSHLLADDFGFEQHNLTDQINAFNKDQKYPDDIKEALHQVRDNGDFAAHVLRDVETGEVVKVTLADALWNLDVLDTMFDYGIVQPKLRRERMEAHEKRSERVGRSPLSRLFKRSEDQK